MIGVVYAQIRETRCKQVDLRSRPPKSADLGCYCFDIDRLSGQDPPRVAWTAPSHRQELGETSDADSWIGS